MGYILNNDITLGTDSVIVLGTLSTGRLKFGKAYRAKRMGFFYDGITEVDSMAPAGTTEMDLDGVRRISMYVTLSRKEPSAISTA